MAEIKRALISVSDKTGVAEFAQGLAELGVDIISTGGTAKLLKQKGIPVTPVSEITKFPEMLDGRVKTLHPAIHGGILAKRDMPQHMLALKEQGISPIDIIVVNLYPFQKTVANPEVSFEEAIENIDIGGPTMIRSAAKNFQDVAVVVDPADYPKILAELKADAGKLSLKTKFELACKTFQHTASYDSAISSYLESIALVDGRFVRQETTFPSLLRLNLQQVQGLRYGENPHQQAAFYREIGQENTGVAGARQLQGKELSFNNILDLEAAYQLAWDFEEPVAIVIKHTNPCGVAVANGLSDAYRKARETDPVSAFGSVLGFNRVVDSETAVEIVSTFVEAVIAPGFDASALDVLQAKPNLRLLVVGKPQVQAKGDWDLKRVSGGLLIQDRDTHMLDREKCKVVTKRQPTEKEWEALSFAWKVVKHVKSNAIVFTNQTQTVGIGVGQMSRVDSSKLAVMKAQLPIKGTVLASDAFFPFRDGVDAAAEAGATAIIQPGGSLKDKDVIQAADEHSIAMVFTGIRHFKH
jgi:phosphoribosylaminoimidazolecarboxamide formyltransferase/IMP cyclohydrolase